MAEEEEEEKGLVPFGGEEAVPEAVVAPNLLELGSRARVMVEEEFTSPELGAGIVCEGGSLNVIEGMPTETCRSSEKKLSRGVTRYSSRRSLT